MTGPLNGFRILDLTTVISGPFATMLLADQGADVIKVEGVTRPDHARGAGYGENKFTATFLNNNRNKRSLALDLKSDKGTALLLALAAKCDVFIQNFRPGVVERLGIGEDAVRAVAPDIIYVSISGFGETGPLAHKPVYDPIVQAISGLTSIQGGSDEARPRLVRTIVPDKLTGMTTAQAVTSALLHREITGEGQHVRVSMLDSVISFLWSSDMGGQTFVGKEVSTQRAATFIDLIYETKTDYISVSAMTNTQWQALSKAVGHPEWVTDERFKNPALRDLNADERLQMTQEALLEKSSEDWLQILDDAGVPCAPVLKRKDVITHPQVVASNLLVESDHPHAGKIRQTRPAARFSRSVPEMRSGAPLLGEHTDEILTDLGFSADDIAGAEDRWHCWMKIGLISDTHIPEAMPDLWPHVFEIFHDVKCILHAGDIHDLRVLDQLEAIAPVYAARGNGEDGSAGRQVQPEDPRLRQAWLLELEGFKIGLTHYVPMPEIPPGLTIKSWKQKLFPDDHLDVLIYGDTHVEQIDLIDNTLCVNPGSPTFPHNLNLQLGTIGLLHLDDIRPRAEILQLTETGTAPFDWKSSRRPW